MLKLRIRPSNQWLWGGSAFAVFLACYFGIVPLVVQYHCNRARGALYRREDRAALEELRAALRLDPEAPSVYLLLARTSRRLGELDRAALFLKQAKALEADPDAAQRETWLVAAQSGDLHSSEPHLGELLADDRSDGPDICEAFVQGYFANLRVGEAFQLLEAWQRDYADDPQAYWMEGYLCQALSMTDRAVKAYRRGLELAPDRVDMQRRLAEVLLESQQIDEAIRLLQQCDQQQPDDPEVLALLAEAHSRKGATKKATTTLQRILEIRPDHFQALRQLGELRLADGHFNQAAELLQRAIDLRPYDTTAHNALGKALRAAGRDAEAKPHFDYVAEAEGPLADLERKLPAVLEHPNDTELRYQIGRTLLKYGDPDDGIRWLRSVLQLNPDHQAACRLLATLEDPGAR